MMRASALIAAIATAFICGCNDSRRAVTFADPVALSDPQVARGQIVFMNQCNECHPGGSAGLGPGINDKPLPGFLIKTQIRRGLGAMPAFDESEIPDADLDNLIAYLGELRRSEKP